MPNINQAFPSKYLSAPDLNDTEVTVTMDKVTFEEVGSDKDLKPILYFTGKKKGLVLNKTNARKITEITGSGITEEWAGQQIRLYPTETTFGADIVECIRVKPVAKAKMQRMTPPAPPPPPIQFEYTAPLTDEDIPFAWLMPLILPMTAILGLGLLA